MFEKNAYAECSSRIDEVAKAVAQRYSSETMNAQIAPPRETVGRWLELLQQQTFELRSATCELANVLGGPLPEPSDTMKSPEPNSIIAALSAISGRIGEALTHIERANLSIRG